MRRNDETNDQTDLQRSVAARGLPTGNMEKNAYKSDLQKKKEMWKKWVTVGGTILMSALVCTCGTMPNRSGSVVDLCCFLLLTCSFSPTIFRTLALT